MSFGGSIFAAASATLPKVVVRPVGLWVMTLFAALHSEAGTFHSSAAAAISISRAAAPPLRTYSWELRMPRLPPVDMSPQTRLRARFWPGVGYSVVTFDQSHSSSSATSWARPVSVPWPISERAMRITTVSSGRTTTQALTSGAPSAARATSAPNGNAQAEREAAAERGGADDEGTAVELGSVERSSGTKFMAGLLTRSPRRGWPRAPAGRCRSGRCW